MERLTSKRDSKYEEARKQVTCIKEFYQHLFAYCLVIPFIVFVNYMTYWEFKWFWFSAIGWGIGLGFHAYHVFVKNGFLGSNWEKRKIEEFMRKDQEEGNRWN